MNPGLVVKLRPAGPWRIGPDSGARNKVDAIYHSDTLYGAVTSAMGRLGSFDDWLDATARGAAPAVCFSSAFPFLDEIGFVPPPRTVWPPPVAGTQSARVRWKSARFVPLGIVQAILSGKRLDDTQWMVDGPSECLVPVGRLGPFRMSVRWSAAVDRLSGASERHSTACLEFRPGAGLWTVVSFADDAARERWLEPVKAAFRLLADSGFGGERSRGWGRAESPEFLEGMLPEMVLGIALEEPSAVQAETSGGEPSPAPPLHEPPAEEPPVTEPPAEEQAAGAVETSVEEPSPVPPVEPPGEEPPVPPVQEPPAEEPPVTEPPAEEQAAGALETSAEEPSPAPPVQEPPAEEPPVTEPASEAVAAGPPETSVEEPPAPVAPMTEAPAPEPSVEAAPAETHIESGSPEPLRSEAAVRTPGSVAPLSAGPRRPAGRGHWLLSLYTPSAEDTVDWARGSYTVVTRSGRVDRSGELKKQLSMVAEGSVVYAASAPRGSAPDVAPDGSPHPVFRAGFALSIPLPEVTG
jgi:CRISPR type III-A-associated RAMP protein Csm4